MQCNSTGAEAAYDLCYGTKTSQRRPPAEVVDEYKRRGISKVWLSPAPLSSPDEDVISILKHIINDPDFKSKIKVVLCIDYTDLHLLADISKAKQWVDTYITHYESIIGYVCVGDVIGSTDFSIPIFKEAMGNLEKLLDPIKLATIVNVSILLGDSYKADTHPSASELTARSKEILLFLSGLIGSPIPLFVRIMPYFMISKGLAVENCILRDGAPIYMNDVVNGNTYPYSQAFDAMLDSICCALKKVDGLGEVDIRVVSGWPTAGPTLYAAKKYAKQYIPNLVQHIGKPTPRGKKPVDIFIYSLVDEDKLQTSVEVFKHLGAEPYLPTV